MPIFRHFFWIIFYGERSCPCFDAQISRSEICNGERSSSDAWKASLLLLLLQLQPVWKAWPISPRSRVWKTKFPGVGVEFPFSSVEIFPVFWVQVWKNPHERLRCGWSARHLSPSEEQRRVDAIEDIMEIDSLINTMAEEYKTYYLLLT